MPSFIFTRDSSQTFDDVSSARFVVVTGSLSARLERNSMIPVMMANELCWKVGDDGVN